MRFPVSLLVLSLTLSGCRCGQQLQTVEPARLVVTPQRLTLGPVFFPRPGNGTAPPGLSASPRPRRPPRRNHALAYDSARQRVMLFNGTDTWVFLP